jgi:hypothetical protein
MNPRRADGGDSYGDVTAKAMAMAMERVPRITVSSSNALPGAPTNSHILFPAVRRLRPDDNRQAETRIEKPVVEVS